MIFAATKQSVSNRGRPPDDFLEEIVGWGKVAADEIFAVNSQPDDIYDKVKPELGPWVDLLHRRAVMLEVLRVLGMFESSGDFKEGVDTSRLGDDTDENAEAGAWQISYDARKLDPTLLALLVTSGISDGVSFQRAMKFNHILAMDFTARLMRSNTKHNGPLYKGDERLAIRRSLRGPEHSIYPWLRRDAVEEFRGFLV